MYICTLELFWTCERQIITHRNCTEPCITFAFTSCFVQVSKCMFDGEEPPFWDCLVFCLAQATFPPKCTTLSGERVHCFVLFFRVVPLQSPISACMVSRTSLPLSILPKPVSWQWEAQKRGCCLRTMRKGKRNIHQCQKCSCVEARHHRSTGSFKQYITAISLLF